MKKAVIFYQSKTGTTKNYAHEIEAYLQNRQIQAACYPVSEYHSGLLENADLLLLGCWTKGLMVLFQKPDALWNHFARRLTVPASSKVALFATYKIRTGSMFRNMAKQVQKTGHSLFPRLKSRDGKLTGQDRAVLNRLIQDQG